MTKVTREQVLQVLVENLEPLDYTRALWEAGAAAFNRQDEWSDIDLHLVVDDKHVNEAFAIVDRALESLSPIELKYELPQPTWHGHTQAFYRLELGSRFLIVDLVVMQLSHPEKYLETELHGQAVVHFDKSNVVQPPEFDWVAHHETLKERLSTLGVTFDLFQFLTLKEINRGNDLEAISFYYRFTLNPLVEVLRIEHTPARYNFSTRHIHYDLPQETIRELRELFFVEDLDDLRAKRELAEGWFYRIFDELSGEYGEDEIIKSALTYLDETSLA